MARDVSKMTKEDLARERQEAEKRIRELQKAEAEYDDKRKAELRQEVEEMLRKEGFSVADVFGVKQTRGARGGAKTKGVAKYRHPENPEKTWTGKGRQPVWFKEHVEKGGKPEDLAA